MEGAWLIAAWMFLFGGAQALAAQEPHEEILEQALGSVQTGDLAAALSLIEPYREDPEAPAPIRALLGFLYVESGQGEAAMGVLEPLAAAPEADPGVLYNTGRAALLTGDVPAAEAYLERAVELAPGSPAARQLGMIRARQGRPAEGYRLLRRWALATPDDHAARLTAARLALDLSRPEQAAELLEGLPVGDPRVALFSARSRLARGDAPGAVELLAPLVVAPPPLPERVSERVLREARLAASRAALETGDPERVVAWLADDAADPAAALLLARAHLALRAPERAAAVLEPHGRTLAQRDGLPDDPEARLVGAEILRHVGELRLAGGAPEEGLQALERAARLDASDPAVWRALAGALVAVGRTEEAQQAEQRAQDLAAPGFFGMTIADARGAAEDPLASRLHEAVRWAERGEAERALEILDEEIHLATRDLRPRLLKTQLLLGLQRLDEARESVDVSLAIAPGHPDLLYQRGIVRMARGDLEAAEADLRLAIKGAPEHIAAMNDLAVLLMLQGERQQARELLQRVLRLRPDDPRATENLRRLDEGELGLRRP